jgi:hypothetical protein
MVHVDKHTCIDFSPTHDGSRASFRRVSIVQAMVPAVVTETRRRHMQRPVCRMIVEHSPCCAGSSRGGKPTPKTLPVIIARESPLSHMGISSVLPSLCDFSLSRQGCGDFALHFPH